ncbi:hypothetical protein FB45DRAFT_864410 [Roridomyces roridus]|uniref:Uncharacterized protein n=1 Tax=Roridomyces roridus TaxID=1738132 RepID=A0AAD7FPU4_9AGAR|nr:hypothetical protein FB45DRAFT_864410 [Roridomyces roridus]
MCELGEHMSVRLEYQIPFRPHGAPTLLVNSPTGRRVIRHSSTYTWSGGGSLLLLAASLLSVCAVKPSVQPLITQRLNRLDPLNGKTLLRTSANLCMLTFGFIPSFPRGFLYELFLFSILHPLVLLCLVIAVLNLVVAVHNQQPRQTGQAKRAHFTPYYAEDTKHVSQHYVRVVGRPIFVQDLPVFRARFTFEPVPCIITENGLADHTLEPPTTQAIHTQVEFVQWLAEFKRGN